MYDVEILGFILHKSCAIVKSCVGEDPRDTVFNFPLMTGSSRGTGPRATGFAEFFPSYVGRGPVPRCARRNSGRFSTGSSRGTGPRATGFAEFFPSYVGRGPVPRCARRNSGRLRQGAREGQALALRTAGQFSPEIFDMNCENNV